MTNLEISELSDIELLKAYLIARTAFGEVPGFMTDSELSERDRETLAISTEMRSRGLSRPSQQSIGRRTESEYTKADHDAWVEAIEDWDGVVAAPKGFDVLPAG